MRRLCFWTAAAVVVVFLSGCTLAGSEPASGPPRTTQEFLGQPRVGEQYR